MGLCKCPKRKVTCQFCFEHRVNVCEHCMVSNHPKCVVQSYLQWLQDSDCNPICTLCLENLSNAECVRLTCYHVFHWACLHNHARDLPSTTAPAGYVCPTCQTCIFPQANLVSPVADVLREKLAPLNWARAGLGLPLLSDERDQKILPEFKSLPMESSNYQHLSRVSPSEYMIATSRANANSGNNYDPNQKLGPPYSVVNVESSHISSNLASKKVFEAYDEPKTFVFDHDENKYQRKSALDWFRRWWKLLRRPPINRQASAMTLYKRYAMLAILGVLFFGCVIVILSWLGRLSTDDDPSFNVYINPQVNVEHNNERD